MNELQKGDAVIIQPGHKDAGKPGKVKRLCSPVFKDHCYIILDIAGRQRVPRTILIEKKYVAKQ